MKNILVQGLAGLAFTFVTLSAHATPIIVTAGATTGIQIVEPSYGYIKMSTTAVGMFNAFKINGMTASNGASVTLAQKTNTSTGVTSWANIAFNVPLQAITFDSDNKGLLSEDFRGSFKMVATPSVFTTGGELTLSNLRVDYMTKTVYATVVGANGVGTRYNAALWSYDSVAGDLIFPGGNIQTTVSALRLTADGLNIWAQSLGYTNNGRLVLASTNQSAAGLGTLSTIVSTTGAPPTPPQCPAPAAHAAPSPF